MFVERKLEEAARAGAFDHLPGAGAPLDLTENPFVPADWRLAFKILADHQIVPEFVERRREIEGIRAEIDALKSDRSRDREWRRLACSFRPSTRKRSCAPSTQNRGPMVFSTARRISSGSFE